MIKKNKGITIVALTITIIVLLIIAGIAIVTTTNSGLINEAQESTEQYNDATIKQIIDSIYLSERNKYNSGLISASDMINNIKNRISTENKLKESNITYTETDSKLVVSVGQKEFSYEIINTNSDSTSLITFEIEGETYQVEEGTTWQEFVDDINLNDINLYYKSETRYNILA